MEKLAKTLRWLLLATAIVPMVYLQTFFSPFLTAKVLLFRTLVELALIVFLVLLYKNYSEFNFGVLKRKVTWLPAILLAVLYLASIFGLDFYNSFWSDFIRMEGLITYTHLAAFFYLIILSFKKGDYLTYIKILAVSGLVASLYGLGQRAGVPFLAETGLDRAAGTLGNAAFLASYLIFSSFFALYLIVKNEAGKRWFWWVTLIVSLLGILYSGTRGAILALIVTLLVYLVYYLFIGENRRKKTYAGVFLGLLIVGGIAGYSVRENFRDSSISIVRRFANIGEGDATSESRLFVWKNTLSYIQDRPLLGYGVENFAQAYDNFYDPTYVQEDWFDRTHNIYLDYAFSSGVVGLLIYLLICGYILWNLFKESKQSSEARILFFMFVAYMIQNFFVFDSVSTMIVFYFFIAYIISRNTEFVSSVLPSKAILKPVYIILAVAVLYTIYPSNFVPMRVNYALSQGYLYQMVDVDRSIGQMEAGLSKNSFAFKDYAYQSYQIFLNQIQAKALSAEDLTQSYNFVSNLLRESIDKRPYDVRLYTYLVSIYEATKQNDFPVDVNLDEYEVLIKKAIDISPRRPELRYMLSNIYMAKAEKAGTPAEKRAFEDQSIQVLKDLDALVPETATTKIILANILFNLGRLDESGVYFNLAVEKYNANPNEGDAEKIISFLLRQQRYAETVPFYEFLSAANPTNYPLMFDLAQAYFAAGEVEKSFQALEKIRANSPETLNINPDFVNLVISSRS